MNSTKFRLATDFRKSYPSNPGDSIVYNRVTKVKPNGELELVISGKDDLYASIQSHADSCNINVIIKRYQNGDLSALQAGTPSYGDFSEMPKTYAEVLNAVIAGERLFDSLPADKRELFDNDAKKFIASIGSDKWCDALGIVKDAQNDGTAAAALGDDAVKHIAQMEVISDEQKQ